ncbi:MAG TPA: DUF4340 domain-containing protein [Burkholderiales bacterium]|nr:DUF4340 domain-containing protein [Burkholderiales bacterium]
MSRTAWLNALLACAVAALAVFAYLKPRTGVAPEYAVAPAATGEARSIRIERPDAAPIVLEKREGGWAMTAPLAARADELRVQRLLAIPGAKASSRLAATDLARFELDRPAARVIIDGRQFDFGIVTALSREQYLLTGGAVYTVGLQYGAALPARPADLIDKRPLSPAEMPVRFEFTGYTVAQDGGKWVLKPPGGELSQDDYQRWVDGWRHASALRVEPYAKGKPVAEMRVELRNGAKLAFGELAREPETALLRSDEKLVYYFVREAGQRLLAPPGSTRQ